MNSKNNGLGTFGFNDSRTTDNKLQQWMYFLSSVVMDDKDDNHCFTGSIFCMGKGTKKWF